ncbi:MAG: hypothetical protein J0L88_03605 [Xanthomonadales bacterium]|nr:hypothetical protein [Xanthomonadales bacterium]
MSVPALRREQPAIVDARRLAGLDLLRVVAGGALMVCHAGFWLAPFGWPDALWFMLGHVGVEAFLVCTTFLAAHQFLCTGSGPGRAVLHGALRLWPLYALLLGINALLGPVGTTLPPSLAAYAALMQNLVTPHPPFFGEAWIVAAAMLLAVVVPLLCALLRRLAFAPGLVVLAVGIVAGWGVRALAVAALDPAFDEGVRKVLAMRLDLPFYGVALAWLAVQRPHAFARRPGALALLGVITLAGVAVAHFALPLDRSFAARVALPALCDVGWCLLVPWATKRDLATWLGRPLAVGADAAYAGLLTHMTLLRVLILAGVPATAASRSEGVLRLVAYVAAATILALVLSRWVDRPWRRWLGRRAGLSTSRGTARTPHASDH